MCLAILKPAAGVVPLDRLRNGWISNPDGGGYGYVHNGKSVIRKGFDKLKEFTDAYAADAAQFSTSPFLIHFRIRTMGAKDADNTHPFQIENGILIHNGSLNGTGATYGTGKSDTALFAERFSKDLTYDFVHNNRTELSTALGYNKVAILYDDGRYTIINEKDGYWDNDVWYSNKTYTPRPSYSPRGNTYDDAEWLDQ